MCHALSQPRGASCPGCTDLYTNCQGCTWAPSCMCVGSLCSFKRCFVAFARRSVHRIVTSAASSRLLRDRQVAYSAFRRLSTPRPTVPGVLQVRATPITMAIVQLLSHVHFCQQHGCCGHLHGATMLRSRKQRPCSWRLATGRCPSVSPPWVNRRLFVVCHLADPVQTVRDVNLVHGLTSLTVYIFLNEIL